MIECRGSEWNWSGNGEKTGIIGVRIVEARKAAKDDILRHTKGVRFDVLPLHLSSMEYVKKFSNDFHALNLLLNILM